LGHSAGGYDSTHAILSHPEFYKVAVSSAGCHDNRMDKATWNEQWMGWPVDKHYEEESNYTLASKLEGKLFLAHGDVDENVPIPATISSWTRQFNCRRQQELARVAECTSTTFGREWGRTPPLLPNRHGGRSSGRNEIICIRT
jgi:hypothetical protein